MKTLTIREAREGLSHPDQMFADSDEVLVMNRGEPVARILPVTPTAAARKKAFRSLAAFRATMPFQDVPSEVLIREDRDERG
jgi:antitoxin (DNA-binding transcriptional repressor) of toxin-antitoxin stability system